MMHAVILAVYVISAVSLLVIYFLVNRQQRKKEKKQTSKPQDLVPKKTRKVAGVGDADRRAADGAVGLNPSAR